MDIVTAVITCFSKFIDFSGRAKRAEYWWFALFCMIVQGIGGALHATLGMFLAIFLILPTTAAATRRLHDVGRSGWWQLLSLTGIGAFVILYWLCKSSQDGRNRYESEDEMVQNTIPARRGVARFG